MSADDARSLMPENAQRSQAYYNFSDKGHPDGYRRQEIQALLGAILARENRLVLGLPGMGVSNLLRFMVAGDGLFERDVIFAYLDCDTLAEDHTPEAFFEAIAEQLHDQGLDDKSLSGQQGYRRLKRLVIGVEGDSSRRLVIVADQADRMLSKADRSFYRQLKWLTDLNKRVCWILAAGPRSAESVDPDNLLFPGRQLFVGRLNERDCSGAIAEEAQRLGRELDAATQARLAHLSGGHPGLLRALSSAAAAGALDASAATLANRLVARGDVKARCKRLWDALDSDKRAALQSLANSQVHIVDADTLAWLHDFGLVDTGEEAVRLFSPIFEQFVADQATSVPPLEPASTVHASSLEPVIIDNPTFHEQGVIMAGKVFKGSQELHVSTLELRLIACLKRERKVYTKQAIADYVYFEDNGVVSDSAIETLVSQVRGKLGYEYIKTYYRQGYEFMG